MGLFSLEKIFGIKIRESANDGSDFSNPDTDYRMLFLGEDGQLHLKDSAGSVTSAGGGGGSVVPNLIMDYTQSSDINGVALTQNTYVDVLANQNFTVANASSLIAVIVGGMAFNNVASLQQSVRFQIDSAGTPINRRLGGFYMDSNAQGMNFFAGSVPVYLSGLSAAVHTIKLQATSSNATPGNFYCRPTASSPFEYLTIQIVEFLPA